MLSSSPARRAALVLALATGLLLAAAVLVWRAYDAAIEQAFTTAANLASTLDQQAARTIEGADAALTDLASDWADGTLAQLAPDAAAALLRRWDDHLNVVEPLVIFDRDGRVRISSRPVARAVAMADADFFQAATRPGAGLVIGVPIRSPIDEHWLIPVARPLREPAGGFAGVVMGGIRVDLFERFYSGLTLGTHGLVAMTRRDGRLLARVPGDDSTLGALVGVAREPDGPIVSPRGRFASRSPIDNRDRLGSYVVDADYPFRVAVGVTRRHALAGWYRDAVAIMGVAGLLAGLLALTGLGMARESARRARALARVEAQRAELAATADRLEQARATAHEAHEAAEAIFEHAASGLALVEPNGRFVRVNRSFAQLFGIEPDAFPGQPIDLILPPAEVERRHREVQMVIEGLAWHQSGEWTVRHRDGHLFTVYAERASVQQEDGRVLFLGSVTDLTRIKAAEARVDLAERRLRDAVDSMPDGLLLWDADDRLVLCNNAVAAIQPDGMRHMALGRSFEEILRVRVAAGVFPNAVGREDAYVAERLASHRNPAGKPVELTFADGRWLRVLERRTSAGGWVAVGTDISAIKQAEAELRRAKADAEAAMHAQARFLAMMSHEMRTPMVSIIGFTDLVLAGSLEPGPRARLQHVRDASHGLLALLNDVLDFSKVEAGLLELQADPFDLAAVVESCRAIVAPSATDKGLALSVMMPEALPTCRIGDAGRLRQVLLNLLSNAVKFTAAGAITIEVAPMPDGRLRFTISDTGVGISPDRLPDLFKEFSQADRHRTSRTGGAGLGLAICRRLVTLMGGDIGVESRLGGGSRFWFAISLPEALQPGPAAPADDGRARILVVDDVAMTRELASAILETAGHGVVVAEDGRTALEALESGVGIDLVLMDVHMPVLDGLAATEAIRASGARWSGVPILAMTAGALPDELERCRAAGMDGHVAKPFDPAALLDAVRRYARRMAASA